MRNVVGISLIFALIALPASSHPRPRKHTHHGVAVLQVSAPRPHPDRSHGWIEFKIKPLPEKIWVDGRAVEPARRLPLPPGFHQLRLEWSDGTVATREIKLNAGSKIRLGIDRR